MRQRDEINFRLLKIHPDKLIVAPIRQQAFFQDTVAAVIGNNIGNGQFEMRCRRR